MPLVRLSDIEQGQYGTCAVLAEAPGRLEFRRDGAHLSFKFHDRLTGQPEWVTIRQHSWRKAANGYTAARNSSAAIERAYFRWHRDEGIPDEAGLTGKSAVDNGNHLTEVRQAYTGGTYTYEWMEFDRLTTGSTLSSMRESTHLVNDHAYRVTGVTADSITLYNPWAYDGRSPIGANDGYLTFSKPAFLDAFHGVMVA
jgi:hypothetical protein